MLELEESERRIVAWLRRPIEPKYDDCEYPEDYAIVRAGAAVTAATREIIADAIERREHRKEPTP